MPVDASIALGVKPMPIESPINQMAKMYEMQNAVQSNQLNQMKMDEYKRGLAETESWKQSMSGVDASTPQGQQTIYNGLLRLGKVDEAAKFAKGIAETANLGLTGKETEGKVAKQKQDFISQAFRNISQNPSDQNVIAWGQDAVLNKHFTLEEANGIVNTLLSQPAEQRSAFLASQGASASDLKPTIQTQGLGNRSVVSSYPAFGGAPTQLSSSTIGQSPDSVASGKIQMRGQDLTNARELQRINQGDRRDVVASTLTDSAGNVTQYNKFGELLGTKPNAGKPSATFEKTKAAKQQMNLDLDLAIKELTDATKPGGLIETATGSGAGALRDIGAGFFGSTTEGAEALGALQPIYDKVLKMVPRFEGPQSDKDTISYNKAAGDLGNPNAPTGKKLAAAKTILRLMKDRKAQFLTRDMAEGGTIDTGATSIAPPAGFVPD